VVLAHVKITPTADASEDNTAPLLEVPDTEAREHGETTIQLRESERYEYEVIPANGIDLRLRSAVSARRRSLGPAGTPDAGLIETRSFCGTLLLELVEGETAATKHAAASTLVDVRSIKLDYRTQYRGMLRRLADELAGLVADARSSAKASFRSTFEDRTDEGWLQIQLELLRETLDSTDFSAALQRILSFPHERLSTVADSTPTDRPIRWAPAEIHQLLMRNPRRALPAGHPLRSFDGIESVAERVFVPRKSRDLDTPENRFVKFALRDFRAFLTHAQRVFETCPGWGAAAALTRRLSSFIDDWLGRGLFREVGEMRFAPLGSPVLQRKAGYREILRWWLRFRTAAELSWEGGENVFRAGQRDVASLYEYWLFFELLEWFCRRCRGGTRPPVEELVEGLDDRAPNLKLRKRMQLGPFVGSLSGQGRRLNARFAYNRRFDVTDERRFPGSWTRRMHPDYTLTFWPEGLDETEAERRELLVHVHFDAKYRVEDIEALFGADDADDADEEVEGNYKRQDLLKMHAYRDAIKRSQGAYVLYPGRTVISKQFRGFFHEILPGLGAFGIAPDENGIADGLKSLETFLDEVLAHIGNRTTALERVNYHISEAYALNEAPVRYGALRLPEADIYGQGFPALPPAEHYVLVAWYRDQAQLEWTKVQSKAILRLGKRPGAWHIQPEFAQARHLLLHTRSGAAAPGLWRLVTPGYRVFTGPELGATGYPGLASGEIYALFEVAPDPEWAGVVWQPRKLLRAIRDFESSIQHKLVRNLGRKSAFPRILPLRDLLKAKA
jgi:predicted component of viral defense system (DUF524 family)